MNGMVIGLKSLAPGAQAPVGPKLAEFVCECGCLRCFLLRWLCFRVFLFSIMVVVLVTEVSVCCNCIGAHNLGKH